MPKTNKRYWLSQVGLILVGLELIAISINYFYGPAKVAAGGATGIAILLEELLAFKKPLVVLTINIVMIILAIFFLKKSIIAKIIVGSFVLPVCLAITPTRQLVDDRFLAVVVGGMIFAIGVAILYRIDASSGGTTVPPMILKKYFGLNQAQTLLMIDALICIGNIFVAGWEAFILAIISLIITSVVMNYIATGLDRKKAVYIMSNDKLKAIRARLDAHQENHGLTILDVKGGYRNEQKEMIMVVTDTQGYGQLIRHVHQVDRAAFITTYNIAEVHGGQFN